MGQILSLPLFIFGIFLILKNGPRKKIKSEIFSNKKEIRLDYFINNVLYKKDGYYLNQRPVGKNYDFITSPEISQIFGEIIGLYFYYFGKIKLTRHSTL